jgi:hypothetical protein
MAWPTARPMALSRKRDIRRSYVLGLKVLAPQGFARVENAVVDGLLIPNL